MTATDPALAARPATPAYGSDKIRPHHLDRLAVVYVRQSSPQQVLEHRESAALQYGLAERAADLGWPAERVLVIDEDQGQSGRSAADRLGFQRLLAEVGLSHVGLVLGIEMSRLARSCKDWHQLLELCALFGTLLADQDGLYDPAHPNDRLLLGLKGTMSEAELHLLKGRMEQGRRNKARRGELVTHVPCGYVRQPSGEVALDPDEQAQAVVRLLFRKFEELGSAKALLRYMVAQEVRLPVRPHRGPNRGRLEWHRPRGTTVWGLLHNPIYAGAYAYGRRAPDPRRRGGRSRRLLRPDQWEVLLPGRFPAYITWDQYLANQKRLADNRVSDGHGAPRHGPALLTGLIVCRRCDRRMAVHYVKGHPIYDCLATYNDGGPHCQRVSGDALDELVGRKVLEAAEAAALELSLRAADGIAEERRRLDEHWQQRLERAAYEAECARRQYDAVEPENRLVARELERRWEQALADSRQVQEDYARFRLSQPAQLSADDGEQIRRLASDLPAVWAASSTTAADRKVVVRSLVERVVVDLQGATERVEVAIHWKGGSVSRHEVVRSVARFEQLGDFARLKARVLELRGQGQTAKEIAGRLNAEGFRPPRRGKRFTAATVRQFLSRFGLVPPRARKQEEQLAADKWWLADLARELRMPLETLRAWGKWGWFRSRHMALGNFGGAWVAWADAEELGRLRRLRAYRREDRTDRYPAELTTPKPRTN